MKLANVSIDRPVFATMMVIALIVLGLFSYAKLNIDQFPDVDFPYVTATTVLPGAGPEQIESDVTKKIEDAVNPIAGVDHIQSISQEGVSIVIVQFKLEVDGRQAAQEVREKIAAIRANLPTDIKDPVIQRIDPASQPILTVTVAGERSEKEITTYTKDVIKKRLENVPGVGSVDLVGGAEREIQIEVDGARLQGVWALRAGCDSERGSGQRGDSRQAISFRGHGSSCSARWESTPTSTISRRSSWRLPAARWSASPRWQTCFDGVKERVSLTRLDGERAVGLNIQAPIGQQHRARRRCDQEADRPCRRRIFPPIFASWSPATTARLHPRHR